MKLQNSLTPRIKTSTAANIVGSADFGKQQKQQSKPQQDDGRAAETAMHDTDIKKTACNSINYTTSAAGREPCSEPLQSYIQEG
jgi:hypothetical protein